MVQKLWEHYIMAKITENLNQNTDYLYCSNFVATSFPVLEYLCQQEETPTIVKILYVI